MNLYRKDRPNLKKEMGSASFPSEAVGSLKREQEQAHLFSFLTKIEIRLHTPDLALTKFPTFLKQESASIAKQKALKTNTYRFNTIQR